MTTMHDRTPVPRIPPRRGFAWLPMEQQMTVFALVALVLLAFLPLTIDSARAGSGELKQAMLKPRSISVALARLERHYGFAWWTAGSAGEQRIRHKLLALSCGVALLGACAAWKAQAVPTPTTAPTGSTTPRRYGTGATIRARAASTEEDHHG